MKRYEFPKNLPRLTPEREREIAQEQAEHRARHNLRYVRASAETLRLVYGATRERASRAGIETLERDLKLLLAEPIYLRQAGRILKAIELKARAHHELINLAEALTEQGRYDKAAEIEPREEKRREWQSTWEAIWRDDDEMCQCPPDVHAIGDQGATFEIHPQRVHAEVYSVKHGRIMPFHVCSRCPARNVREKLPHLERASSARRQAREAVKNRPHHEHSTILRGLGLADHQVLNRKHG